jgi:hypothetical protein
MEVQPTAAKSKSQDADSSPWRMLDTIALGNRTLNLTAPIPVSQAAARIEALNAYKPSDPAIPFLTVTINGERVEAKYGASPDAPPDPLGCLAGLVLGHFGILAAILAAILATVRPIFRGYLSGDEQSVRLRGRFGVNTLTRVLGFSSLVLVVALCVSALLREPLGIGYVAWLLPAVFVVMCLLTRANEDDLYYLQRNLQHALDGDL